MHGCFDFAVGLHCVLNKVNKMMMTMVIWWRWCGTDDLRN